MFKLITDTQRMSKRNTEGSPPKAKRKAPDTGNKNEEISSMLSQLSDYEKNVTNNVFKAKAYKKAAHAVRSGLVNI